MATAPERFDKVERIDKERDERGDKERAKAVEMAVGQIEKQFGKGIDHAPWRQGRHRADSRDLDGIDRPGLGARRGRPPARTRHRDFRTGVVGQDDARSPDDCAAQKLGGSRRSSTRSTHWTRRIRRNSASTSTSLLVSQPDNGEQALDITKSFVRSNGVDVVVVDSVAALVPRAEIESEMGERRWVCRRGYVAGAPQARRRRLEVEDVLILSIRCATIGVMFGNPETTTGGRALKLYSSVRIDIRRIGAIKDGDTMVGGRTRARRSSRTRSRRRSARPIRRGGTARASQRGRSGRSGRRAQHHREERHVVLSSAASGSARDAKTRRRS